MATLYLDVDTQLDFVSPAGALYVPGAEGILPAVAELNHRAIREGHRLMATMDAHTENDPEFRAYPPHCVAGRLGQRKPEITKVNGVYILEKQTVDCFSNPALDILLRDWQIDSAVVYGVVTEICVLHAAKGLLDRGIAVSLVQHAVKELSAQRREEFFCEFSARGGRLA